MIFLPISWVENILWVDEVERERGEEGGGGGEKRGEEGGKRGEGRGRGGEERGGEKGEEEEKI